MKTIVIGDIHACHEELKALLDKIAPSGEDRIISVGDLVCKGPSTVKTLDLVMSLPHFSAVMGNHDYYLVKNWQAGCLEELTGAHARAVEEMDEKLDHYMKYLEQFPFYLEQPEYAVVHGGIRPGLSLTEQSPHDLMHLRELEEGVPWYSKYKDPRLILFGHWAKQGLVVRDNAIGLDTGCVYGRKLTACILPERKIVSVDAKKVYSAPKT